MAAETLAVSLTSAEYTALSAADATVVFQSGDGALRVYIGSSAPSVDTSDYYPLNPNTPMKLEGLTTENVYARSEGATATARVMRA